MKSKLFLAIAVAGALLLTGCVTIRIETKFNPDLSGEKSMLIAMDDSVLDMAKTTVTPGAEAGETDPFAEFKNPEKLPPNVRVEEFHDDFNKQTGVKIIASFANLDELVTLSETGYFSSTDKVEVQRSGDAVTVRMTMNKEGLTGEMGAAAGGGGAATPEATPDPEMVKQMANMFEFTYSVAPAGEIVSYSPQEGSQFDAATNAVSWRLDLAAQESPVYEITWKPGGVPAVPPAAQPPAAAEGETPAAPPGAPATEPPAAAPLPTPTSPLGGLASCGPCSGCLPGLVLPLGGLGLVGLLGRKRFRS